MEETTGKLVMGDGFQVTSISYPHLSDQEIFEAVEAFYRRFFFRPRKIAGILGEMLTDRNQMKVRLGEARDFFGYLRLRENRASDGTTASASG